MRCRTKGSRIEDDFFVVCMYQCLNVFPTTSFIISRIFVSTATGAIRIKDHQNGPMTRRKEDIHSFSRVLPCATLGPGHEVSLENGTLCRYKPSLSSFPHYVLRKIQGLTRSD